MYLRRSLGSRARFRSIDVALRTVLEPLESRLLMDAADALQVATLSLWALPSTESSPVIAGIDDYTTPTQADPLSQASNLFDPSSAPTTASGLPILNSLPGAPVAIYMDLDGDTGTGTTTYDEDGHPDTFNADEQAHIEEAWRQMAVYFAMFDVNITTQLPSVPMVYDVIGNNAGGATGGYAYVGTFPNTSPQAFNNSDNVRSRVSAIAHEVGHVFGLDHQSSYDLLGNKTAEYASATDPQHGPLMGVDYSGDIHKWIIGHPSSSASSLQDDLQVIAGKIKQYERSGGDGFRRDDYSASMGSATALLITEGLQSIAGIIERIGDSDTFSFLSSGGPTRISAMPDAPSAVDLKLEIYDANGNLLVTKDADTNDAQVTMNLPAGMYYATLLSHGDYGDVGVYNLTVNSLPANWKNQDVGSAGVAGYSRFDPQSSQYIIAGAGADISGTADSFQFAYQTLTGDGSIIARVDSFDAAAANAKAGLMIRDSLNSNARSVAIVATPQNGPLMLWRTSPGGTTSNYHSTATAFSPLWLKLVREGSTFTTYTSADGVNFTLWNTTTVTMGAKVYVGLAVSSQNRSSLATTTFTDVALDGTLGDSGPTYNTLPAPTGLTVSPGTGTGLDLTWELVPGATGYAIERSSDGVTYTRIAARSADVTTYSDNNLAGSKRYFYRVSATDDSGASVPCQAISAVNRPSAPTGLTITSLNTNTLVLNWKDVNGESGYRIEQSTDGVTFTARGTVGKNIPSYTDNSLSTGVTYYYRVIATSALGDSPESSVSNGTTRLPAVTGMAFDSVASTQISFHWSNLSGETGYRIERSNDGTTYSTLT
ncbi:MAG: fibronectin type III domain-containing protein, partial [Bacillota bacterium]